MNNPNIEVACRKVKHLEKEFENVFGVSVYQFAGMLCLFGVWDFDILKFEKWLKCQGYNPDGDGSIRQFCDNRFKVGAGDLIGKVLRGGGEMK